MGRGGVQTSPMSDANEGTVVDQPMAALAIDK
jgi:hypothetical protein